MKYIFRYTIRCMIMDLESGGIIPIRNKQNKKQNKILLPEQNSVIFSNLDFRALFLLIT